MKTVKILGLLVVAGCMVASSYATTIGFEGAGANNADISSTYGSDVTANGTGWTVDDGTGTTEDISLEWLGGANTWEAHSSTVWNTTENLNVGGAWDDSGDGTAICQLDDAGASADGHLAINFTNDSTTDQLKINSLDIGLAGDMPETETPYEWIISITTQSDTDTTLFTHTTATMSANSAESVAINFTGTVGEDYTLHFDRTGTSDYTYRGAIDNVSFSQIPEPATLGLLGFAGGALLMVRRKLSI